MTNKVAYTDPDRLGGTPVFKGTRVPIQSLFDYLENGETLQTFLKNFPTVTKDQAIEVLKIAKKLVTSADYNESIAWRGFCPAPTFSLVDKNAARKSNRFILSDVGGKLKTKIL